MSSTGVVVADVVGERVRQDAKWGPQNHPDCYDTHQYAIGSAQAYKDITDTRAQNGDVTYIDILLEEVAEAVEEAVAGQKSALRTELVQVAAVAVAWVEKLDRESQE